MYCKNHAPPGALNVRSLMCQKKECLRQATRKEPGKKPTFCAAHAEKSMVDFVHKKCSKTGCDTFARGSGTQALCMRHAAEEPAPGVKRHAAEEPVPVAKRPRETDVRKQVCPCCIAVGTVTSSDFAFQPGFLKNASSNHVSLSN